MKYGVAVFTTSYSVGIVPLARQAEALGYESLWVPDHPVIPEALATPYPWSADRQLPDYYRHIIDPFVGLAAAAGATTRLRIGTAVLLVPERNPLILAKEVATLDQISGGRLLFGIGAGWLAEEGAVFGVDWKRRWRQTRDYVRAMQACWADDVSAYAGDYANFPPLYCHPKPLQRPHPPLIIAGELKGAVARIAEFGHGWMPRALLVDPGSIEESRRALEAAYRERGRDPAGIEITIYGAKPDRDDCRRWADAGADRIIFHFGPKSQEEMFTRLQRYAEEMF